MASPDGLPPIRLRAMHMPSVDSLAGLPLDGDPPERRRKAEALSQTVERILRRHNLRVSDNLDSLLADWEQLAGPGLCSQLRPGKCEQHILYVYAGSSAELFEIRRYKLRALEARIKQHPKYTTIHQVRLQLDPG